MEITMQNNPFVIPASITAKVDEIMATNQARFGHDAFRMEGEGAAAETSGDSATATGSVTDKAKEGDGEAGQAALGDAGKRALDAMKAERNTAKTEAAEMRAALAELQAKIDGKEAEHAATQAAEKIKTEALNGANERILKAEIRAAAAGKLTDPADALAYIDLSKFDVTDDGEVDATAITAAIADLISKKPYLAAQGGKFQGSADAGTRNETGPSIDDQIAAAQKAGNFAQVIALKRHKATATKT
jgi:hypothetical protein